ncbi:uncharacterized protein O3C94_002890 [Discoglossus pictus]
MLQEAILFNGTGDECQLSCSLEFVSHQPSYMAAILSLDAQVIPVRRSCLCLAHFQICDTSNLSTQDPKPKKRGRKKKNTEVSALTSNADSEMIKGSENENESVKSKKLRKKKTGDTSIQSMTSLTDGQHVEVDIANVNDLAPAKRTKGGNKKKLQAKDTTEQNLDDIATDLQKKPAKRGRKKGQLRILNE